MGMQNIYNELHVSLNEMAVRLDVATHTPGFVLDQMPSSQQEEIRENLIEVITHALELHLMSVTDVLETCHLRGA